MYTCMCCTVFQEIFILHKFLDVISPLQQQTLGEAAPLQVMLCKLVFSGSWPPTSQPAEWSLSHSW